MVNYSTLGHNLKRGIFKFSKKLSDGLKKPTQKFIADMLYGILASQSSYLTKMARKLNEKIALDKTVERLSRNLMNFEDTETLTENYLNTINPHFDENTVLLIDDSDISKPYSNKLEGLCRVKDGSTGELTDGNTTKSDPRTANRFCGYFGKAPSQSRRNAPDNSTAIAHATAADTNSRTQHFINAKNMLSDPQAKAKVQRITPLSVVKSAVEILEQYNITTLSKLQKTLAATETKFDEVNEKTKAVEERLKKLNPLIKQADLYLQHREINRLYKQQKPKHKDQFFENNRAELTLYQAAERFLQANLDGKTLNTKAWKKEATELTAEKDKLYQNYTGLKEGVRQMGVVRRSVEHILDNTEKMEQPQQQKRHDIER